jgi:predicted short-subunit dehydrogenase-like oxidoreductase (DUF2520 family)
MKKPELGFIGAGTVGTALAVKLSEKGYKVVAVSSRRGSSQTTPTSAQKLAAALPNCQVASNNQDVANSAEFVFITTPDDVIPQVAAEVKWHSGQSVVHCSGADSLDILNLAKESQAVVGAFHPLQTFANVTYAIKNIPGSTFALEGESSILETLKEMAEALEGHWIVLHPGDKVLYHASAVIISNYLVTLMKLATDLWKEFGNTTAEEATQALLPLLKGTISNIDNIGLPNCLTGPIARGDLGTIKKHIQALEEKSPTLVSIYRELGLRTIPLALSKGKISEEDAEELKNLFLGERDENDVKR